MPERPLQCALRPGKSSGLPTPKAASKPPWPRRCRTARRRRSVLLLRRGFYPRRRGKMSSLQRVHKFDRRLGVILSSQALPSSVRPRAKGIVVQECGRPPRRFCTCVKGALFIPQFLIDEPGRFLCAVIHSRRSKIAGLCQGRDHETVPVRQNLVVHRGAGRLRRAKNRPLQEASNVSNSASSMLNLRQSLSRTQPETEYYILFL